MQTKDSAGSIEEKIESFWRSGTGTMPKNFYNTYDYAAFWKGRKFEDGADRIAVKRLMKKIPLPHHRIIDIGGGIGRMSPLYEDTWSRAIILDPSSTQLAFAKKNVSRPGKINFIEGSAELIPLAPASCDAALCVRVFHYIEDPRRVIKEIWRVLAPDGYLILEIPNKIHAKARLRGMFSGNRLHSRESISRSIEDKGTLFINHHPTAIQDILFAELFEIVEKLSVSNFRNPFLKKVASARILLFFEKILQRPLAKFWFGPSIYFLARKKEVRK